MWYFHHHLYVTALTQCFSSAQLLEPFRMNHEIQLQGMGDLERAPGGPASLMSHTSATVTQTATSDLEDPPGLYEKVRVRKLLSC